MNNAIWSAVSTPVLNAIAVALRGGQLLPPFPSSMLSSTVPSDQIHAVSQSLCELTATGLGRENIAVILDMIIADRRCRPSPDEVLDLVLSGPDSAEIASRDTLVVLDELFSQAAQCVMVVGYAIHQGETVFESLAKNMEKKPALAVEMFLNIQRPPGNTQPERELVASFLDRLKREQWPQSAPLPAIYYFPASLDHSSGTRASLHAKCIVADRKAAWISSANFTAAAHKRNIEVGVLLRTESIAQRLAAHFDFLKETKILLRIA
jgi:hypothetical protein